MWRTLGCAKCVALLWSNVVCVGCSGPYVLGRKVLCARVVSAMVCPCDGVVSAMVLSPVCRIHDVAQALVVTEVLWSGSCCPRVTPT